MQVSARFCEKNKLAVDIPEITINIVSIMLWADAEQLNIIWKTMNWYMKPLAMSANWDVTPLWQQDTQGTTGELKISVLLASIMECELLLLYQ